jgi:hypothetical protein
MTGAACDEDLIEAVIQGLLVDTADLRGLVRHLVETWPDADALQVISAVAMAAGTVEHMLAGPAATRAAQDAWRMSGLLGVDLYMMQRLGLPHGTARDLQAYWRVHDPFFLVADA